MKQGDLVVWIGFPGSTYTPSETGSDKVGIVTEVIEFGDDTRINVMWGNGTNGSLLYPGTLEVISELNDETNQNRIISKNNALG